MCVCNFVGGDGGHAGGKYVLQEVPWLSLNYPRRLTGRSM